MTLWICLLLLPVMLIAQSNFSGKILDATDHVPLAFVNILYNDQQQLGTVSDIDGEFHINTSETVTSLTFSYVGYEQKTVNLKSIDLKENVEILLNPTSYKLGEVVVLPGENPANRIIREVIKNKPLNNPALYDYKCNIYNKIIYDYHFKNSALDDSNNSVNETLNQSLKGGHIFILESITERKHKAPDLLEDRVVANKMSGFKDPAFAALATDIQPFSFHDDYINIYDGNYLNPISKGSLNKYNFYIEDTLFQEMDSIYVLSFQPKKKKNFDALKGLLYIHTNKYAIQNVIASPAKKGLIDIKIEQKYSLINDKWFPAQLNFESLVDVYGTEDLQMKISGRSYISKVLIDGKIDKKSFSTDYLIIDENANQKDEAFWEDSRATPLNDREMITYEVIDSIGEELNFDGYLNLMGKILIGKIPVNIFDINIPETFIYNKYEGIRLGINAVTNERLSKRFYVGGFYGYGLKDKEDKYGFEAGLNIIPKNELWLSVKYQNNLREIGSTKLNSYRKTLYDPREILAYKMDNIIQKEISINARLFKYAKLKMSFADTEVKQLYQNVHTDNIVDENGGYKYKDLNTSIRFAFREKTTKINDQRIGVGTSFPVLYLSHTLGLYDKLDQQLTFNKIEVAVEDEFRIRNLGLTKFRIEGAFIDRSMPLGLMFTGKGANNDFIQYLVPNYFQTMQPYEFMSNQYINIFFSHDFGSLIFNTEKFSPQIIVHHNAGWGRLSNPNQYNLSEISIPNKGYFESGLQLNNLIKKNYFKIAYFGFGIGGFYRYGPYVNASPKENIALNFTLTFTTR